MNKIYMVKEGFDMKCPFCDAEMIHGYLNCGNAIWSERKHKISIQGYACYSKYNRHLLWTRQTEWQNIW